MYLQDILDHSRWLRHWASTRDDQTIVDDPASRAVVERYLQNIGEAMFQLRRIQPMLLSRIDESHRIIGMRHILVHGYSEVDPLTLVRVIRERLAVLERQVVSIMDSYEPDEMQP